MNRNISKNRSSHQAIKKGVLRHFTKLARKHLCHSLFFNKVAGLRPASLSKKRLWRKCFPVNFTKFLRTPILQNTSRRLLLQDIKEKRLFLRKKGNNTKERHIIPGKYVNLYQNIVSNFARLLKFPSR